MLHIKVHIEQKRRSVFAIVCLRSCYVLFYECFAVFRQICTYECSSFAQHIIKHAVSKLCEVHEILMLIKAARPRQVHDSIFSTSGH